MIKKKCVAAICKAHKRLKAQTMSDNTQWIGIGEAMYILAGIEPMSLDAIASMLDYTEKDISKMGLDEGHADEEIFSENNSSDIQIETPPKRVIIKDAEYLIYETGTRLIFINSYYLKPIVADDQTTYFMRTLPDGMTVLCVKKGFLPEAIICGVRFDEQALHTWFDELCGIINNVTDKYINNLAEMSKAIDEQLKLEESDDEV
ncbi:MAG: hypothetical protein OSJ43_14850 [Oscillospiraceae bacterium]|nr:hypothetical protein [Oscillospiraceae bacterium]